MVTAFVADGLGDAFGSPVGVAVGLEIGVIGEGEGGDVTLVSGRLGGVGAVPPHAPSNDMLAASTIAKLVGLLIVFLCFS